MTDLRDGRIAPIAVVDVAESTDNADNAIEARIPRSFLPNTFTVFAATGLWDPATAQWMAVPNGSPTESTPGGGSPLVTSRAWNVAFRADETGSFCEENKAAALARNDISFGSTR